MESYLHSPIDFRGVLLHLAQGQLCHPPFSIGAIISWRM